MQSWLKKILSLANFISIIGWTSNGFATDVTTPLAVSAQVSAVCTISSAPLAFGTFNPTLGTQLDASTTLTVTCTSGTSYQVGLDAGGGSGATVTTRVMTGSPSGTLNYSIFQDTNRQTVWGNTFAGGGTPNVVTGTGSGAGQTLPVYGRIFSGQPTTPVASYTDSVTATIRY